MSNDEDVKQQDVLLVRAMADGDRGALARLYDRHANTLMALGVRVLGDREAAQDLLHDVFLEAWRRAGTYDESRGSVKAWLAMRMRSRALDRIRKRKRTRTVSLERESTLPERKASTPSPDSAPDRQRVRRCLAELPENQRAVLQLAYFAGLSSTEIAARLELPIGTVKSRTAAALRRLRGVLRAGGEA